MNTPAFPTVMIDKPEGGMTLRDYFAAKAMQALLMQPDRVADAITSLKLDKNEVANHVSLGAYHFADAMLKARKQ